MAKLTPMLEQYYKIKESYPDSILFFRVGDFYETFFEDAKIASRELEITLTGRDNGSGEKYPLAGVPFHSADPYIAKLVSKGYKVAICEQIEDPKEAKGIVKREVIRVVTPGTILDPTILEEKENNYLAAIAEDKDFYGFAYLDFSTGEFAVTEIKKNDISKISDELFRIRPKECLISKTIDKDTSVWKKVLLSYRGSITYLDPERFNIKKARKELLEHFSVFSLEPFGCEKYKAGIGAAGALISYLKETQKSSCKHVNALCTYIPANFMLLDEATKTNLELLRGIRDYSSKGTLFEVLDFTCTAMGGRTLRKWIEQPLLDLKAINKRLDAVEELKNSLLLRKDLQISLKEVYDLERLAARVAYGTANGRDLIALKLTLSKLPQIKEILDSVESEELRNIAENIDGLEDIYSLIDASIAEDPPIALREGGIIKEGYSQELDLYRRAKIEGKQWIAQLEQRERERTGIKSLKVKFNKVFGYYIEVTKANLDAVPSEYIRKQTLTNAERYITEELKEFESMILNAEEKSVRLEYELFIQIRNGVAEETERIQNTARQIGKLDVFLSFAEAAAKNNYCKPKISNSYTLMARDVRHPVVEQFNKQEMYIPNDVFLDKENRLAVITGPNMAGKSTYCRSIAILVIMAQIGSYIPASEGEIGIVDRIFTRIGSSDNLAAGASTFMVEMSETAHILNHATERSLIILDEVGRGTSTFDGLSIAWAISEYIHNNIKGKTLFATHYHELTELEGLLEGAKNYSIAVKEHNDNIIFLRKIVKGGVDKSYGIQVAKLAGLPETVILRAKEILLDLEKKEEQEVLNRGKKEEHYQLSLFSGTLEHPILQQIRKIDINTITPVEALNMLYLFQRQLEEK
jgi:DNA mismatch repair protein MutS